MAQLNQYEVQLRDGRRYTVETPRYHVNEDARSFEEHLIDILKQTVAGVITIGIGTILFKGKVQR